MSCGCGCSKETEHKKVCCSTIQLTKEEQNFINLIDKHLYLPVAEFIIKGDEHFEILALSPVFIENIHQSMDETKEIGNILKKLEEYQIITLDFDIALEKFDYNDYKTSDIYKYFCQTVDLANEKEGFLGKKPYIQCGSIALTKRGIKFVSK